MKSRLLRKACFKAKIFKAGLIKHKVNLRGGGGKQDRLCTWLGIDVPQNTFLQQLFDLVIIFQFDYRNNTLKNKLGRKP